MFEWQIEQIGRSITVIAWLLGQYQTHNTTRSRLNNLQMNGTDDSPSVKGKKKMTDLYWTSPTLYEQKNLKFTEKINERFESDKN